MKIYCLKRILDLNVTKLNRPWRQLHLTLSKLSHIHVDVYSLNTLKKVETKTCISKNINVLSGLVSFVPLTSASWKSMKRGLVVLWLSIYRLSDQIRCEKKNSCSRW